MVGPSSFTGFIGRNLEREMDIMKDIQGIEAKTEWLTIGDVNLTHWPPVGFD